MCNYNPRQRTEVKYDRRNFKSNNLRIFQINVDVKPQFQGTQRTSSGMSSIQRNKEKKEKKTLMPEHIIFKLLPTEKQGENKKGRQNFFKGNFIDRNKSE